MSAHIFIDAENIKPEIAFKAIDKFSREYPVEGVDIIGKEDAISQKYLDAKESYHIQNCYYGKNSADTWLVTEIARTIFEHPEVEVLILVSSDRDFLPAIKLAADQNRKVIIVSNGLGHKGLKAMLYDLRINPDLIELVDFRTGLAVKANQKRGPDELMENSLPSGHLEKLLKICDKLSPNVKNFFIRRQSKVKFIFVKHGDNITEIPFVNGINLPTFTNILREFKIIRRTESVDAVIADSFLKIVNNAVHLLSEDELNQLGDSVSPAADDFLDANADEVRTIFVKHGDNICEIPFVEGVPADIFEEILRKHGISNSVESVVKESFLDLRDDKIYFRAEEAVFNYVEPNLKKLSSESRSFLKTNATVVEYIPLTYSNATYKIPFVDGMHLSILVHILRDLKIFSKSTPTLKVLANNGLDVTNNIVHKI